MFNISFTECIFVLMIAMIVFGPTEAIQHMQSLGKLIGKANKSFKKYKNYLLEEIEVRKSDTQKVTKKIQEQEIEKHFNK